MLQLKLHRNTLWTKKEKKVLQLTQIIAIQMGASLLCHIHVHIEKAHRVPKVLPRARIQHQHSIMGHRTWEQLMASV